MESKKKTAFTYNAQDVEKLSKIARAAEALATAAEMNNVTVEELYPLVVSLAKKKLLK